MRIVKPDIPSLQKAAKLLHKGHLIAVPTETVYGLAADATNDRAVASVFETKGRPTFNPLIVHVANLGKAEAIGVLNEDALKLADAFWPGPLTLVVKLKPNSPLSKLVTAGLDTVAIRVPAHPVMQQLLAECKVPLAAPSANASGRLSPTQANHVEASFKSMAEPSMILDGGPCHVGLESTIIDVTGDKSVILRKGGLSDIEIRKVIDLDDITVIDGIKAPGMLAKHYAPKHKIRLNVTEPNDGEVFLGFGSVTNATLNLSATGDLKEAASHLFDYLHQLDALPASGIAVAPIPDVGLGKAINDRLKRAAE